MNYTLLNRDDMDPLVYCADEDNEGNVRSEGYCAPGYFSGGSSFSRTIPNPVVAVVRDRYFNKSLLFTFCSLFFDEDTVWDACDWSELNVYLYPDRVHFVEDYAISQVVKNEVEYLVFCNGFRGGTVAMLALRLWDTHVQTQFKQKYASPFLSRSLAKTKRILTIFESVYAQFQGFQKR